MIKVVSRHQAAHFLGLDPYVLISITDPGSPDAAITVDPKRAGILRLKFSDVGEDVQLHRAAWPNSAIERFTDAQALEIANFVIDHPDKDMVVHCEAGISRSPAVAAAICARINGPRSDAAYFKNYIPNSFVYKKLVETFNNLQEQMKLTHSC
jgi:predicted protein tyrosine phosphatase